VHQCMLHLLDSPLSRSGRLQVFLRTAPGILIMVDPRLHVPRSMRLFEAMMTRLLFKLKVRSTTNQLQLLRVVRNPVTGHLPENTRFIRVERGGTLEDPVQFCQRLAATCGGVDPTSDKKARNQSGNKSVGDDDDADAATDAGSEDDEDNDIPIWERSEENQGSEAHNMKPFAFVIGGMARGDVDVDYCGKEHTVSFSTKPMSAAAICSMLCHSLEMAWLEHDYAHATNVYNG
jgi:rRNA small subunit pseudouridine methyltransferase Nep1